MPEESGESGAPLDLEEQLDALLAKMDPQPPSDSAAGGRREPDADSDVEMANHLIDQHIDEQIDPEPTSGLPGDDLTAQIQGVLNEIPQGATPTETALDPDDFDANSFEAPDQLMIDSASRSTGGGLESSDPPVVDQAATESNPQTTEPTEPQMSIAEVDAMLAQLADKAQQQAEADPNLADLDGDLGGAFASPNDLLDDDLGGAFSSPDELAGDDLGGAFSSPDELASDDLGGAFASPNDLAGEGESAVDDAQPAPPSISPEPAATTFSATAEQVQRELDAQPDGGAALVPQVPITEAPGRSGSLADKLAQIEPLIHRICAAINKPLEPLSAEWRNTIGYVGLLTLGNALFLLIYAFLF